MRQILAPDAIFGTEGITQEDKDYHGSRFSDVKAAILTRTYLKIKLVSDMLYNWEHVTSER
jgi:hypothetical protein